MRILALMIVPQSCYTEEDVEYRRKLLISYASSETKIDIGFVDSPQNYGLRWNYGLGYALLPPYIAKKVKWAEQSNYDAVMVHELLDVGVDAARHMVKIPVVGPGRVMFHLAASLANKIGVVAPNENLIPLTFNIIKSWGLDGYIASIGSVNIPPEELKARKIELKERFIALSKKAIKENGAEIICSVCAYDVPFNVSPEEVEKETGVPVLNGLAIGIKTTEMLVHMRLSHSRKTYPFPERFPTLDTF